MNQQKTILALDLGLQTGWAINHKNHISSGSENFGNPIKSHQRFEGGGMRFLRFNSFLSEIHEKYTLTEIYFEEVAKHGIRNSTAVAHIYGGFLATLTSWAEAEKIPYQGIPVGTIKKHITGKGNANKDMMVDAVKALGFNPHDHNQADAIAVLNYVTHGVK